MKPSFGRVVISLVLVPYLALSALAPEHVHEADADHPRSAAHRHLQPHSAESHDSDHAQLADDDEHVVWLDGVVLYQSTYQFVAPAAPPTVSVRVGPAHALSGPRLLTTTRRLLTDLREPVSPSAPLPASPPDLI